MTTDDQVQSCDSGTLRERIAEAARKANTGLFGDGPADDWYQIADAIIADLGFVEVMAGRTGIYRDEHGRLLIGDDPMWGERLSVYAVTQNGGSDD